MKTKPPNSQTGSKYDPQQTSLKARFGGNANVSHRSKFQWTDVHGSLLVEAVTRCIRSGDALMFGSTRDGGAGVVTILSGDERKRFYPSDIEEGVEVLLQVSWAYSTAEERREFPDTFNPLGGR